MGIMKLILLVLFNFCFPASCASLANHFNSGNPSEKIKQEQIDESNGSITGVGVGTVNQIKFAHAAARGGGHGGGGHSAGKGGNGGGGSNSAGNGGNGGGAAVVPVFAAGAAGAAAKPKNHHGAANRSRCQKDKLMMQVATTLTSLLLHISM